ncbi:MAG TPA: ABC transporter ATP-binding protein [Rectinemataceae bacterium]|nr:ABC transporter ATP-binding protein [Rectinemataceae bacterium]
MAQNSVSVTVRDVTKRFKNTKGRDDIVAVRNSDFVVAPGELVTLLGPSGCGKTTTLRMIAGFELPSSGRILIGEEDVTMLPPNLRDTATVFQSYGLFPHMNVADNVAYGLKVRKLPKAEIADKVQATLDLVGLSELADRAPGRLSGGQQQRVALARSLVVEPKVLLLDEPLSNLDALLREQMRIEIRRIQKSLGITAVYVTHDRVEAMSLSDRVVVMKDGIIRQIGAPSTIYASPDSRFVAGFVGKVAFFPVRVESIGEGGTSLCTLAGKRVAAESAASGVSEGDEATLMARPESLRLAGPGEGAVDGRVTANVYLGSSVECFVATEYGEILVQIDDPSARRLRAEGSGVSISFDRERVRLLPKGE